jgi:ABC-type transport system involved in multi-copper enzyme maturation permease subunit
VGTARLPDLTATVQAGLFTATPSGGNTATTTGTFQHITTSWPGTGWTATNVGGIGVSGVQQPGTFRQRSDGTFSVTGWSGGSSDIAPVAGNNGSVISVQHALVGTFFGLLPLIVVSAMFITGEYRRGLISVSLTAAPRRGRLLAAKAIVIGAIGFVAGVVAAALALAIGTPLVHKTDIPVWPVTLLAEARMAVGTGALLALAGVLALAIGVIAVRSAPATAAVIVVIFVPFLLAFGQGGGAGLMLTVTPAAAMAVQQALPRFYQVVTVYRTNQGYYPLPGWAGLAVEGAWTAAALALAFFLLRRRDA